MDSCEEIARRMTERVHIVDDGYRTGRKRVESLIASALQVERDQADDWEAVAAKIRRKTEDRAMEDRCDLEAELELLRGRLAMVLALATDQLRMHEQNGDGAGVTGRIESIMHEAGPRFEADR